MAPQSRPIILTLQLDGDSQAFFQAQRARYFPPAINYIDAHLTLFHNLPGERFDAVLKTLARACAAQGPFALEVCGLMKLGRGVAYKIDAPALLALREALAEAFEPWLVKQDRERFRPHVTVQNKVSPAQAAALYDHLSAGFEPFEARAEGVQLWFYEGGPNRPGTWAPAGAVAFGAA